MTARPKDLPSEGQARFSCSVAAHLLLYVDQSSFVDFTGYRITNATTPEAAYNITDGRLFNNQTEYGYDVALVLPRVQDPTALLAGDWAAPARAAGAQQQRHAVVDLRRRPDRSSTTSVDFLRNDLRLTVLDGNNSNYVTSAESRTIWVYARHAGPVPGSLQHAAVRHSNERRHPLSGTASFRCPRRCTIEGLWFEPIDRAAGPPT